MHDAGVSEEEARSEHRQHLCSHEGPDHRTQ